MSIGRMSGEDLKEQIRYFIEHPDLLDTLILDTADWAEKLCQEDVCMKRGVKGIEDVGYGKGYTYMEESWRELLKLLDEVIICGIHVVVTAHAGKWQRNSRTAYSIVTIKEKKICIHL